MLFCMAGAAFGEDPSCVECDFGTLHSTLDTLHLTLHTLHFGDMDRHFAWQAWHVWHWAGSGGTLGSHVPEWSPRLFAWQAWHLATSTFVSRGRRGTWRHGRGICVAGAALVTLCWLTLYLYPTHTLHLTLYTYTPHPTLYIPHFTLDTPHSTLHTPHSTLYTHTLHLHFALFTVHVTLALYT